MKTFSKSYLPETVKYNGKIYKYDSQKSASYNMIKSLNLSGCVCVEVLSRNLKGKVDFHGQPYKPTKHIFSL
jgi:hypothetical protein